MKLDFNFLPFFFFFLTFRSLRADLMVTSGAHNHGYTTADTLQDSSVKLQMANIARIGQP